MNSPDGRIFSSWKEIARFLGKGVRTVQRWEKTMGLPVRRPNGMASNVVVASESDLRRWMYGGGESSVDGKGRKDLNALRDLEAKLNLLEETHQRLEQALAKIESRFTQIESSLRSRKNLSAVIHGSGRRKKRRNGEGLPRNFNGSNFDIPDGDDGDGRF